MTLIAPELLEILRCTVCYQPLTENEDRSTLDCANGHSYPVDDGIPNMLPPDER